MTKASRYSSKEKRLFILIAVAALSLAAAGGAYKWNNRVLRVTIPQTAMPQHNALQWYERALAGHIAPATKPAPDVHLDNIASVPAGAGELYSSAYNKRYPLAAKRIFLKSNAQTIALWRQGLKLRYVQRPEREAKAVADYKGYRDLAKLMIVEAHARAQSGDWDGAADSLLDILHFGHEVPRGAALIAGLVSIAIRDMALKELWVVRPHLSSARARKLAQDIYALHESRITIAQTLEEEKRAMQRFILKMTRERDFRPLFVESICVLGCSTPPTLEEKQQILNNVHPGLQLWAACMSKPNIFSEYSRCMDWQIAQMKKPYPLRSKEWPFPDSERSYKVSLHWFKYQQFTRAPMSFDRSDAKEALLITTLALDAYQADNCHYPAKLSELVPRYLPKVPLDPYGNRKLLSYKRVPLRYVGSVRDKSEDGYKGSNNPPRRPLLVRSYKSVPFALYSVGPDSRDDGGRPYEDARYKDRAGTQADLHRYTLSGDFFQSTKTDIVAGVNY
ncbi:MAG TPA: hypothetical protein VF600_15160 [Abditibacteriaceae bacterium]|jgi:hypothetical protein